MRGKQRPRVGLAKRGNKGAPRPVERRHRQPSATRQGNLEPIQHERRITEPTELVLQIGRGGSLILRAFDGAITLHAGLRAALAQPDEREALTLLARDRQLQTLAIRFALQE